MHSAGDMTGSEIMRVLRDEARNREGSIEVMEFSAAVELLKDGKGRACGALFYNVETEEYLVGLQQQLRPHRRWRWRHNIFRRL